MALIREASGMKKEPLSFGKAALLILGCCYFLLYSGSPFAVGPPGRV